MNIFLREVNGFYNNSIYYGDTDSLYIEKNCVVLHKTKLVRKEIYQGKNEYESGGIFYGLFLSPKIKFCSTFNEIGFIENIKLSRNLLIVNDY